LMYDEQCEDLFVSRKCPILNLGLVTSMGKLCGGPVATVW